jgi:hypothetical protein
MITALLSGTNIKRDGTIREWNCVEYSGIQHKTDNECIIRVIENKQIKQINIETFSGIILTGDDIIVFENGKRTSKECYYLPF